MLYFGIYDSLAALFQYTLLFSAHVNSLAHRDTDTKAYANTCKNGSCW